MFMSRCYQQCREEMQTARHLTASKRVHRVRPQTVRSCVFGVVMPDRHPIAHRSLTPTRTVYGV